MVLVLVPEAIVADARYCILASAGFSGCVDGVLDGAVTQPAGVAPVHPFLPRFVQLVEGCHDGVLISTRPLCVIEVQVVATQAGEVGEDDT